MQIRQILCKLNTKDHNQQKSNKKINAWNQNKKERQKWKAKERLKDAQLVGTEKKKGRNKKRRPKKGQKMHNL
jgi:hypothetical protein